MKTRLITLLRWSEKYTKTDMVYLASGSFWLSLSYLIQISLGIISTLVLANVLSKDDLGTYQFILAAGGLLGSFTLTGMGTAMISTVAQGRDEAFLCGVRTHLRWSLAVTTIAFAVAIYYWVNGNISLALAFGTIGIFVPLIDSFVLYESFLQGKRAFRDTVILGMWRKPLPVATVLLTLVFTTNITTLIFVYFASMTIATILVHRRVVHKYQPPTDDAPETIYLAKQFSVMQLFYRLAEHFDKVLIWYLLNPAAVAVFTLAQLTTKYAGGFITSAAAITLPKVAERDLPTLQKTLPRKIGIFFLLMIPVTGLYILLVPYLFNLFLPTYAESIPIAQSLGLLLLFTPRSIFGNVLTAHQQIKALYIGSTIDPVIKLLLLSVLISKFGIWGAVYALILSEIVGVIIGWYLFKTARQVTK